MARIRKVLVYGLGISVSLVAVILALNWSTVQQLWRFNPVIFPTFYAEPADKTEAQQQDIDHLRKIIRYDRSFSDAETALFTTHLDTMVERVGRMSDAEFYLGISSAMALADNGHTSVSMRPSFNDFNRTSADFYWFADGLYIVRAHNTYADIVGARVVEIEGRDLASIDEMLGVYFGGTEARKQLYNLYLLRSPELLHTAGIAASPKELRLKIVGSDGVQRDIALRALPAPAGKLGYYRRGHHVLSADALGDETDVWERSLNAEDKPEPLYLRSLEMPLLRVEFENGVYLRLSTMANRRGLNVAESLGSVLDGVPENGYPFIVLDLRWNPGGNYGNAIEFASKVDAAISEGGKIYVITGPQTFSAAIVFSAMLKRYTPEKTMLLGLPMGDSAQFWAERGMAFILPNSGYSISYATAYHDWENGCTGTHPYCFSLNASYEGAIGPLVPDVLLEPTYEEYASGRDVVLEWISQDAALP